MLSFKAGLNVRPLIKRTTSFASLSLEGVYSKQLCYNQRRKSSFGVCSGNSSTPNREVIVKAVSTSASSDGKSFESISETLDLDQDSDMKLSVGIIGFGKFGQFLAKRLVACGHRVLATSRTSYHKVAEEIGVDFFSDIDDFCEEHPEVVLLASSILSTENVLRSIPVQRLKRNTLFVDVLSVKVFPKLLLQRLLPAHMDVLCTHPMFGPDSGRGSWAGLNFMFEKVRVGNTPQRQRRVDVLLKFFRDEGCRMVEMTCEEHDRQAASTQFITHTVGRILGAMDLRSTDIDTKGFEALLNLVSNTANDSFELYYGLFLYNRSAADEISRLEVAFETIKKQLFGRLHDIAREQLLGAAGGGDSISR